MSCSEYLNGRQSEVNDERQGSDNQGIVKQYRKTGKKEKGRILAAIILLEIGSIDRFATVGNFASYARCVTYTAVVPD